LQAVQLLGVKADELAPLKEAADKDDLEALLKRCQFTQWVMRVQTRTRRVCRLSSVALRQDDGHAFARASLRTISQRLNLT